MASYYLIIVLEIKLLGWLAAELRVNGQFMFTNITVNI